MALVVISREVAEKRLDDKFLTYGEVETGYFLRFKKEDGKLYAHLPIMGEWKEFKGNINKIIFLKNNGIKDYKGCV